MKCDFCLTEPPEKPTKVYKRDAAIISSKALLPDGSEFEDVDGEWLACHICSEMIEHNYWKQLLARVSIALLIFHNLRPTQVNLNTMETRARAILKAVFGHLVQGRL